METPVSAALRGAPVAALRGARGGAPWRASQARFGGERLRRRPQVAEACLTGALLRVGNGIWRLDACWRFLVAMCTEAWSRSCAQSGTSTGTRVSPTSRSNGNQGDRQRPLCWTHGCAHTPAGCQAIARLCPHARRVPGDCPVVPTRLDRGDRPVTRPPSRRVPGDRPVGPTRPEPRPSQRTRPPRVGAPCATGSRRTQPAATSERPGVARSVVRASRTWSARPDESRRSTRRRSETDP